MKTTLLTIALIIPCLLADTLSAQDTELPNRPTSRTGSPSIYIVTEGDTAESIAEQTLGDKDFAEELLNYNRIKGADLTAGTALVIPGRERDTSLTALWRSNETRDLAIDAGADKYATALLKQGDIAFNAATQAFRSADYQRATVLTKRSDELFIEARNQADQNAVKSRLARINQLHGKLVFSTDNGVTWKGLKAGEQIPADSRVRSSKDSKAEIQMPDLSTFIIQEHSEVTFNTMNEDERSGKMDSVLEISTGEIFANIKPENKSNSKFYIKSGKTTIAIRGTTLRANRDEEGTLRCMTLIGATDIFTNNQNPISLENGFGTLAKSNKAPAKPIPLLPPPQPIYPGSNVETTPTQSIKFEWERVRSFRLKHYKIEIARDPQFLNLVHIISTKDTEVNSPALKAGEYYWRISSYDKNNLQGATSKPVKFLVDPNLSVTLITSNAPLEKDGLIWLAPETVVTAEPMDPRRTSVTDIVYSVNSTGFKSYPKGIVLRGNGEFHVSVIGKGATQNQGRTFNRVYRIDGVGPEIDFKIDPPLIDPVLGEIRPLTLAIGDESDISEILYSLNGEKLKIYSGPIPLQTDREHEVAVRARDIFGNSSNRRRIIDQFRKALPTPTFGPHQ